jgi:hypothetical protein
MHDEMCCICADRDICGVGNVSNRDMQQPVTTLTCGVCADTLGLPQLRTWERVSVSVCCIKTAGSKHCQSDEHTETTTLHVSTDHVMMRQKSKRACIKNVHCVRDPTVKVLFIRNGKAATHSHGTC